MLVVKTYFASRAPSIHVESFDSIMDDETVPHSAQDDKFVPIKGPADYNLPALYCSAM